MRTLLVVSSDHHINSTVALCPPIVNLDDGGTYHASPGQRWLLSCWLDAWQRLGAVEADRKILVLNGDLGELDTKRRSNQIVTPNKAVVQGMVADVLAPALKVCKDVYVIRGTAAHQGKSAWLEEAAADDISAIPDKARGTFSWWQLVGSLGGMRIDVCHHASMSGSPWGRYVAPGALWTKILWYYKVERDLPAPDIVIRSHNHVSARGEHVYYTPCWSLITEYGYRTGRENARPTIGLLAILIDGDRYSVLDGYEYRAKENRLWSMTL